MNYSKENPWIKKREPIFCTWDPTQNRGFFTNFSVSRKNDLMLFSDEQIRSYVRMLKSFGFTGMQVTDGCLCWRTYGSYKFVHSQFRRYAEALHEEGMTFTLWVWAANFTGHGWNDPDVKYRAADGKKAYDDPEVFASFDRYYDIYAETADCTDLLIAHFRDPGELTDPDDIFAFTRLLEKKFRDRNPSVRMGVDTWACEDDFPDRLVKAGFSDYLILELPFLPQWREEGKRKRFRQGVRDAGCRLGLWGWYTVDYEIDQLASMYVNSRVLSDVYNKVREQGDGVLVPEYWAELSAYNVLNLFSLYCSAQLMIDPTRDPDELLREITEKVYGAEHCGTVLRALELIRDARSGDTWTSYWWTEDGYVLGGNDPADIEKRAEQSLAEIKKAALDRENHATIDLPVEPYRILELMLPHIDQIRQYAHFRCEMAELEKISAAGADKKQLSAELARIWHPVPDYNTIIGQFGQIEARAQEFAVKDFCSRAGINIPRIGCRDELVRRRLIDYMIICQRGYAEPVYVGASEFGMGFAFTDVSERIMDELTDCGVLVKAEDGKYCLANYIDFIYDFN